VSSAQNGKVLATMCIDMQLLLKGIYSRRTYAACTTQSDISLGCVSKPYTAQSQPLTWS
jgi:hypothetical protein